MGCQGAHFPRAGAVECGMEEATGFRLSKYFWGKALSVMEGLLRARHNHQPVTGPM